MPLLPLDCHLPTQYTTHTITLQQWTNNKTNKSYKQLIYIYIFISHVNVTQNVPDISPLMPKHQDPLLVNHFYQMKASPECLNILIYWRKYWVSRLRRTPRRKVYTGIFYQQIYRICHHILHQVAHIDCSAPSGKQHEPLTGVWGITWYRNRKPRRRVVVKHNRWSECL